MIELTGEVDLCHECEHGIGMEVVSIGGKCLVCAMEHAKLDSCEIVVTLACGGDERLYAGSSWADHGSRGYSEWTPGEPPEIKVGDIDLLHDLDGLEGRVVPVRIECAE